MGWNRTEGRVHKDFKKGVKLDIYINIYEYIYIYIIYNIYIYIIYIYNYIQIARQIGRQTDRYIKLENHEEKVGFVFKG